MQRPLPPCKSTPCQVLVEQYVAGHFQAPRPLPCIRLTHFTSAMPVGAMFAAISDLTEYMVWPEPGLSCPELWSQPLFCFQYVIRLWQLAQPFSSPSCFVFACGSQLQGGRPGLRGGVQPGVNLATHPAAAAAALQPMLQPSGWLTMTVCKAASQAGCVGEW